MGLDDQAIGKSTGDTHDSNCTKLTGASFPGGNGPPRGESLHWLVADRWKTTPLLLAPTWGTASEQATLERTAWRRQGNEIRGTSPISDPKVAFRQAFGAAVPASTTMSAAAFDELMARRSVFDFLLEDAKRLQAALPQEQRIQAQGLIDGLRSVETETFGGGSTSMSGIQMGGDGACAIPMAPNMTFPAFEGDGEGGEFSRTLPQRGKLLREIALAAMSCGQTRVVGYDFIGDQGCNRIVASEINKDYMRVPGDKDGYHYLSHWTSGPQAPESAFEYAYRLREDLTRDHIADLLVGMKKIPSGDGNLLDDSLCVLAGQMSYGHAVHNHTFAFIGKAGGKLEGGRVVKFRDAEKTQFDPPGGRPVNDFLVTACHALGFTDVKSMGDADLNKGLLPGVLKS